MSLGTTHRLVVRVDARLHEPAPRDLTLRLAFTTRDGQPTVERRLPRGATTGSVDASPPNARRWSLDDPFLHEVTATLGGGRRRRRLGNSRGILSWHAPLRDRKLREARSYGQRLRIPMPPGALAEAARTGEVVIRLEVDDTLPGGLAIYGSTFGRYPVDPTALFVLR